MPASKVERVLEAFKAALETVPGAMVERNGVLPEKVPAGGDPTLGDLAFGPTRGRSEPAIEAVAGVPAIKGATLSVTIDDETGAPLS